MPYILTCVGTVAVYLIIDFLRYSDIIASSSGGDYICNVMEFGSYVTAVFAYIFTFYTYSFLLRRRQKEFGLYGVLGMGKKHIALVLFFEMVITSFIALFFGILLGSVFAELGELWILKMTGHQTVYGMTISFSAIKETLAVFVPAYTLLYLFAVVKIKGLSLISLMKSENEGEKAPKANYFLGVLGILMIIGAYILAVTVADPAEALVFFFIAVIAVISGTYLLLISCSVTLCKMLQKSKKYYYRSEHFVSVSSMAYRMKRNGAGLASICVLATMVLVMLSATTCLYFGGESTVNSRYPNDFAVYLLMDDGRIFAQENKAEETLRRECEKQGIVQKNVSSWRQISFDGSLSGANLTLSGERQSGNVCTVRVLPSEDYGKIAGREILLEDNEIYVFNLHTEFKGEYLNVNGHNYTVKENFGAFISDDEDAYYIMPTLTVVTNEPTDFAEKIGFDFQGENEENYYIRWICNFDTDADEEKQTEFCKKLENIYGEEQKDGLGILGVTVQSKAEIERDWMNSVGSLLFLAILLGTVFTVAMVLIIYYKQISEGYEDKARFDIMQKVGMTKREIRKSINSQILTVFFVPLLLATVHLCFAFPMIKKIMLLVSLNDTSLFFITTAITVCVFALFYAVTYRITSNTYYNIVSNGKRE